MLGNKGLKRWVAIPLMLNVVLFSIVIGLLTTLVNGWIADLASMVSFEDSWLSFLNDVVYWLLWIIFGFSIVLLLYYTFIRIAIILGGPFNGYLAEKVEEQLTGVVVVEADKSFRTLLSEIWPMFKNELAKLRYELLRSIGVLVLTLLLSVFGGPLALLVPVIWFVFNAWIYGFMFLDYPLDNNGFKLKEEIKVLHSNRMLTLSFGAGVALMAMIPVLNFLVMPAAVIGATKLWVEQLKPGLALPEAQAND